MDDCLFCKIINNEITSQKIEETEDVLVILSLEGHPLIIPKKHIKDIYELDDDFGSSIMKEAVRISKAVKKGLQCDGINLVQSNGSAAGQDVFHFHLHIKPRWNNDDASFRFGTESVEGDSKKLITEKIKAALT